MFCSNCGKAVREGAKFCGNCGTPVEVPTAPVLDSVPPLAKEAPATMVLEPTSETKQEPPAIEKAVPPAEPSAEEPLGALLEKFKMMNKYIGTPVIGNSVASGTLYVYESGLKFDPKWGSSLHGSGSLIGAIAAAAVDLIDDNTDNGIYRLEQIVELRTGKYMGVYNTLVVRMKNGDVWSFCPTAPGSSVPKLIISVLKPYMDKLNG